MKAEYDNMDTKMKAAVDWFRKDVAAMEARGSGRVSPDLISHVPVALPDRSARLSDIATIGVRDGTTLIITMFEDQDTKHVEKALYAAKIPNVVPQKVDHRTIKVPLPKPTVDARTEFVKIAAKQAEDVRVQLRKIESVGIKRAAPAKHSKNYEQFHKLMKNYSEDLNTILTSMKKSMGVK
ncbi:ribosome recycling factor [Rickenella mellea]|uniref:Ribosome recycling factor n=1 Tax=Rickenella mellea TaxID=50990 RepID=A0A4Y7QBZ3_9AGAM|nr:ribosome recycling factor [Rickenella mellea]